MNQPLKLYTIWVLRVLCLLVTVAMTTAVLWVTGLEMIHPTDGSFFFTPWMVATTLDVYAGAALFYVWIFYRSPDWYSRVLWLLGLFFLGNIASGIYGLWRLSQLPPNPTVADLLLRPAPLEKEA
jgi:hypothetical protein